MKGKKLKYAVIVLVICALLLYIPVGMLASKGLQTEKIDIGSGSAKSIRVAQVSDLQYPKNGVPLYEIINSIREAKPDLIFLTGDIVDSAAAAGDLDTLEPFIAELSGICPAYAVTGNHELDYKGLRKFKALLKENNIALLENEVVQTEVKGVKIAVAGVEDNNIYACADMHISDITPDTPILLLAHRNSDWDKHLEAAGGNKPYVTFSGHGHGGQIRVFGKGLLSRGGGLFPKYTSGLYKKGSSYVVVSRGLGESDFPIRAYNKYHLPIVDIYF